MSTANASTPSLSSTSTGATSKRQRLKQHLKPSEKTKQRAQLAFDGLTTLINIANVAQIPIGGGAFGLASDLITRFQVPCRSFTLILSYHR